MDITVSGIDTIDVDFKVYPENIGKAVVRSLRRGLTTGRAVMARLMADDLGIKVGDAKDAIKETIRLQGDSGVEGVLSASPKRIGLIKFNAKQSKTGVSYRYGQGGRLTLQHAFIARMKSGHEGVYLRKGKDRLPIQEKFGPSHGRVFAKYRADGLAAARASFESTMLNELERMAQPSVTVSSLGNLDA